MPKIRQVQKLQPKNLLMKLMVLVFLKRTHWPSKWHKIAAQTEIKSENQEADLRSGAKIASHHAIAQFKANAEAQRANSEANIDPPIEENDPLGNYLRHALTDKPSKQLSYAFNIASDEINWVLQ